MSDMWRDAEDYADWMGEGRLDDPPQPEREDDDDDSEAEDDEGQR